MEEVTNVLDRQPRLKELLDLNSFTEVCRSFVALYGIGLRVFDADGSRLVDIRVGNTEFCGYVFSAQAGQKRCMATVLRIKSTPASGLQTDSPEAIVSHNCFTGLRYLVLPITHDMDVLGKVIMGPFAPDDLEESSLDLSTGDDNFDPQVAKRLLSTLNRAPEETVRLLLSHLGSLIDVLIHSGYKAHLTSAMHVESITAAHHELLDRNKELEESLDKLRELDRLKSNFLATVSHELRTPLTSVIGYSEMLLEGLAGDLNEEQKEYVSTIMTKGEDLLQLIGSMLDLSKIESGRLTIEQGELDIREIASGALSTVLQGAQKKDILLHFHVAEDIPTLRADTDKIRQCVLNLLTNAIKFTPDGGEVELRVEHYVGPRRRPGEPTNGELCSIFSLSQESFMRISVRDNGIGIEAAQKERIFDTFYQADSSSTRAYGGAGLGLSIVKSYIEAHDGEIWVDSIPGQGSVFSLLLPTMQRPSEALPGSIDG